ncbi:hypothetical protein MUG91_G41n3 [Manis pentadactyla]|nr:hypothetical protein MUG91_G41n3 [Manis pentadactyla]
MCQGLAKKGGNRKRSLNVERASIPKLERYSKCYQQGDISADLPNCRRDVLSRLSEPKNWEASSESVMKNTGVALQEAASLFHRYYPQGQRQSSVIAVRLTLQYKVAGSSLPRLLWKSAKIPLHSKPISYEQEAKIPLHSKPISYEQEDMQGGVDRQLPGEIGSSPGSSRLMASPWCLELSENVLNQ